MNQMAFKWLPITLSEEGGTHREKFEIFHRENPHVYHLLRAKALEYKRAGNNKCGLRMLWEALRFDSGVYTNGHPYKLNDHHTAYYARMLMENEPELDGFFEIRAIRSEEERA